MHRVEHDSHGLTQYPSMCHTLSSFVFIVHRAASLLSASCALSRSILYIQATTPMTGITTRAPYRPLHLSVRSSSSSSCADALVDRDERDFQAESRVRGNEPWDAPRTVCVFCANQKQRRQRMPRVNQGSRS
eukprot:783056-Rhodomonas_salina.4